LAYQGQMQKIYDDAYKTHSDITPFVDYVEFYEKGVSYDKTVELINEKIKYFSRRTKEYSTRSYIMPNHTAINAVDKLRLEQYENSIVLLNELEKTKAEMKTINKDEPLAILNDIQRPQFKPDYTRAIIIGGVVFTGLMLLLIWRIRK